MDNSSIVYKVSRETAINDFNCIHFKDPMILDLYMDESLINYFPIKIHFYKQEIFGQIYFIGTCLKCGKIYYYE